MKLAFAFFLIVLNCVRVHPIDVFEEGDIDDGCEFDDKDVNNHKNYHRVAESLPEHLLRISFEERTKEFILRNKKQFEDSKHKQNPLEKLLFDRPQGPFRARRQAAEDTLATDIYRKANEWRDQLANSELVTKVREYFKPDAEMEKTLEDTQKVTQAALEQLRKEFDEQKANFAAKYKELSEQLGQTLDSLKTSVGQRAAVFGEKLKQLKAEADEKWRQMTEGDNNTAAEEQDKNGGLLSAIYKRFG